jgi:hypothetical protein
VNSLQTNEATLRLPQGRVNGAQNVPGTERDEVGAVSDPGNLRSKAHVLRVLRRVGVPEETLQALDEALPDPVDLVRDANLLGSYGLSRDGLMEDMGSSP